MTAVCALVLADNGELALDAPVGTYWPKNRPAPHPCNATAAAVPSAQRATADSLRQRLDTTLAEIQRLTIENQQLHEQVARRFGQQRADGLT